MLLFVFRGLFLALLIGVAYFAFNLFDRVSGEKYDGFASGLLAGAVVLGIGLLVLLADVRGAKKQMTVISAVFFGLLLGMLFGWLFAMALEEVIKAAFPQFETKSAKEEGFDRMLTLLVRVTAMVVCCYVTISTFVQTRDDFRFLIPYVEFSKQVRGGQALVLDTSAIIDGRIADLCDTRVVDNKLVVPRFVLQELQGIADSSDKLKRNRGRRGLDILKRLQTNPKVQLEISEADSKKPGERVRVDERLVTFAKGIGGRVVTNDVNLNKIAQLQGVEVINLNEVANALKTVALPGEFLNVKVVKAGDQIGQGVGYLDDGTMVVIEQGRGYIGQEISILVTSVLQTPNGRMIFGRPEVKPSGTYTPVGGSSSTYAPVPIGEGGSSATMAAVPGSGSGERPPTSRGPGDGNGGPRTPPRN